MANVLPPSHFKFADINCGDVTLHVATVGQGAPVLFLHGFPEHWRAFAPMMVVLGGEFSCIAPDQRGYGFSDRPGSQDDYHIDRLADDIADLIGALGHTCVDIVAHDWGGLVAWHFASRHPGLLGKLIVFNAPHPYCLQHALNTDPDQRAASVYAAKFAKPESHLEFLAHNAEQLWLRFFSKDYEQGWLSDDDRAAQITAWQQEGAWNAMLSWYRAADFDYSGAGSALWTRPKAIVANTLLVWGKQDPLFAPSVLVGLTEIAPNHWIHYLPNGGHCLFREDLAGCVDLVRNFLFSGRDVQR